MSVPPKRRSASKKRRGWTHLGLKKSTLIACGHCKKKIVAHRVCPYCGYYDGRQVVQKKTKKKKS